jgi:hypothetical protein
MNRRLSIIAAACLLAVCRADGPGGHHHHHDHAHDHGAVEGHGHDHADVEGHGHGGPTSAQLTIQQPTIVELVAGIPEFSTLLAAVSAAGLAETLSGPGPFTVFAPSNTAFSKIPAETLNGLLADKAALTAVLLRHVVPGAILVNTYNFLEPVFRIRDPNRELHSVTRRDAFFFIFMFSCPEMSIKKGEYGCKKSVILR